MSTNAPILSRQIIWPGLFALALLVAFASAVIEITGLVGIALFVWLAHYAFSLLGETPPRKPASFIVIVFIALVVFGFIIGSHFWPGFHNPLLAPLALGMGQSKPLYFSVDKAIVGYVLLFYVSKPYWRRGMSIKSWRVSILYALVIALVAVLLLIPAALLLNVVVWRPHLPQAWLIYLAYNLFVTCVVEEVFFRGLIQNGIEYTLRKRTPQAPLLALACSSVLFAFAHIGAGLFYALLSGIAGAFYGYAYQQSGRLAAAILVHFLVNMVVYIATVS